MSVFENVRWASICCLIFCPAVLCCFYLPSVFAEGSSPSIDKQDAISLVNESFVTFKRGQDILRFVGVKLPSLVSDNIRFRKLDKELQSAQDETYPGIDATSKLKGRPSNLRELIRLYVGLRLFQEKLILLSDHIASIENQSSGPLSVQVMDLANKVGRISLKLHPFVYMVVDAYQAAASDDKVDANLKWVEEDVQGPGL